MEMDVSGGNVGMYYFKLVYSNKLAGEKVLIQ